MMNRAKRLLLACLVLVAMLAMSAVAFAENAVNWDTSVITATGMGMAPANAVNPTQAKLLARRAAVADAYRQLAEVIKGVNVDSQTTVQNMLVANDTVTTRVNALIKGARIVDEYAIADGGYAITMEVAMYGAVNSLAGAVLPRPLALEPFPALAANVMPTAAKTLSVEQLFADEAPAAAAEPAVQPFGVQEAVVQPPVISAPAPAVSAPAVQAPAITPPAPVVTAPAVPAAVAETAAVGGYTGLIVDCSGLGLRPAMSPVIKNDLGTPIYGYKNLDSGTVISKGMAGYTTDINKAGRAGSNPLVVRAVGLDGSNPIISAADANRVLLENGVSKFLDQTNVVFVR